MFILNGMGTEIVNTDGRYAERNEAGGHGGTDGGN